MRAKRVAECESCVSRECDRSLVTRAELCLVLRFVCSRTEDLLLAGEVCGSIFGD